MITLKAGFAAIALSLLAAAPAMAQDHGMSGRTPAQHPAGMQQMHGQPMNHGMQMSRADRRTMANCQKMSRRAMMRNRSCTRVMAMQKRMDRGHNM